MEIPPILYNKKIRNFIDLAFQTTYKISSKTKQYQNTRDFWGKSESV